jgi:hypothetical protein
MAIYIFVWQGAKIVYFTLPTPYINNKHPNKVIIVNGVSI